MLKLNPQSFSRIFWLVLIVLVCKLILLPFAQIVDPDAVSRIYLSIDWLKDPKWIKSGVWAPFHFYMVGLGLMLWNNPILMPGLINILFSTFTIIPFYFFVKREFNKDGAFIASIFFAISPILFRNSFLPLSETPYLFFLALTMNLLSLGLRGKSYLYTALAGISITIAAGLRYEAWIIALLFGCIIALFKEWKLFLVFVFFAMLFPLSWLYTNWLETGNAFFGIQGNYQWTIQKMGNNDNLQLENYLRRIWFFPFSWVIALGIPVAYITLAQLVRTFREKPVNKLRLIYSIPFWCMFLVFQYNAFKGVLLLQHRFIGTLVIFSLPFVADYFKDLTRRKIQLAWLYGFITISLTFVYNTGSIIPLPRLTDQSGAEMSRIIKKNITQDSYLILDFIGWDQTYYIALNSELSTSNISLTDGAKNSNIPVKEIKRRISESEDIILLLHENTVLYDELVRNKFIYQFTQSGIEELYKQEGIIIFRIKKKL